MGRPTPVRSERLDPPAPPDLGPVDLKTNTNPDEPPGFAKAPKRLERVVRTLDRPVAAEHPARKKEADFGQGGEQGGDHQSS